jgi:hypothetical protein
MDAVRCRLHFFGTEPYGEIMSLPTRRTFLQVVAAAIVSLYLPRRRSFWFLHAETGESWQVDDPVVWALNNAGQPILERA